MSKAEGCLSHDFYSFTGKLIYVQILEAKRTQMHKNHAVQVA